MTGEVNGRAWVFGDDVDTDAIIPARYLHLPSLEEMAGHAMEPLEPTFGSRARPGDVIVAGVNFGSGSSREFAVLVWKQLQVGAILAESFARTFYRNALNNGILVLEVPGITEHAATGDQIEVQPQRGQIRNLTRGTTLKTSPLPDFAQQLLEAGGLKGFLLQLQEEHGSSTRGGSGRS
ncbi:3-isopropylmalate dehydratase small subunit [Limnochorda pilosa]|uniref:3-isopropylmalate dehydratase small subunit n=1 Tax=Limnochorda pilosa TaxID=1555112 RepID=A0A0K2SLZ3_LIMPI|nr:3-isopropylmalate dehydratase small subunit [Limnochorda pilosa]BAS28032.1 3-isopropylmalate dehydratase small subunit [Limnochorda pilosa]